MTLYETINNDIKEAMKAGNKTKLEVLRMMKSKVMMVNARGDLPDPEIIKILKTYGKSLVDAIEQTKTTGKLDAVKDLENELAIVKTYLPTELSEADVKALVETVIKETGATSKTELGKVMKAVMSKGMAVDGKMVNRLAGELLA